MQRDGGRRGGHRLGLLGLVCGRVRALVHAQAGRARAAAEAHRRELPQPRVGARFRRPEHRADEGGALHTLAAGHHPRQVVHTLRRARLAHECDLRPARPRLLLDARRPHTHHRLHHAWHAPRRLHDGEGIRGPQPRHPLRDDRAPRADTHGGHLPALCQPRHRREAGRARLVRRRRRGGQARRRRSAVRRRRRKGRHLPPGAPAGARRLRLGHRRRPPRHVGALAPCGAALPGVLDHQLPRRPGRPARGLRDPRLRHQALRPRVLATHGVRLCLPQVLPVLGHRGGEEAARGGGGQPGRPRPRERRCGARRRARGEAAAGASTERRSGPRRRKRDRLGWGSGWASGWPWTRCGPDGRSGPRRGKVKRG
mmetsp:Transcript_4751/g.11781  ORF Transcript_4751/g.11781 Transcript_4751/m.11781 type:complete len:369 (+) Transcript_4751:1507-2613(+)